MQKTKKYLLMALSEVMLIATIAVIFLLRASAGKEAKLSIYGQTLSLKDNTNIVYYVDTDGLPADDVKLLVFTEKQHGNEYVKGRESYVAENEGYKEIGGKRYYVYRYNQLTAKEMTKTVYACAYYVDGGGKELYSKAQKYSIHLYAYNKAGSGDDDICNAMLNFGGQAQIRFDYGQEDLASAAHFKFTVTAGSILEKDGSGNYTVDDGFNFGLFVRNAQIKITCPATDESGKAFNCWIDSNGNVITKDRDTIVTVTEEDKYTPVYGDMEYTDGDYTFKLSPDETYYIVTGYQGTATEIVLPLKYEDKDVLEVDVNAFKDNTALTSITVPKSYNKVGFGAFSGCTSLQTLSIPYPGESDTTNLYLGYLFGAEANNSSQCSAFIVSSLKNLEISKKTSLQSSQFTGANLITTLTISDTCYSLDLDNSLSNLTAIHVPSQNTTYASENGIVYSKDYSSLIRVPRGITGDFTVRNTVTSIRDYAFSYCTSLTSITIPDGVTSIGYDAFYSCSSLTSITIPDSVTSIGNDAFEWCSSLTNITIPDGVTSIGSEAFYCCTSLTSITIPDSVTSIGNSAFRGCTSLVSITISDSVTSIGDYAFYSCSSLVSITIPNSVTNIARFAFARCSNLKTVVMSQSVRTIDSDAFGGTPVTFVVVPTSATFVGKEAFAADTLVCYQGETVPDQWAFTGEVHCGCIGAATVENVTYALFSNETAIVVGSTNTELVIPDAVTVEDISYRVTSIAPKAFYQKKEITSLTIGNNITDIGAYAFSGCTGLTSVTIGNGVTSIGSGAFFNCSSLTSITIPDSVKSIGSSAFGWCTSLTSISFTGTMAQWNAMEKGSSWKDSVPSTIVHCTDGDLSI